MHASIEPCILLIHLCITSYFRINCCISSMAGWVDAFAEELGTETETAAAKESLSAVSTRAVSS